METNEEKILKPSRAVDKAFSVLTRPARMKQLASKIEKRIVKRSRLGYGVSLSGQRARFPRLDEDYIEVRKGLVYWFTTEQGNRVRVGPERKVFKTFRKTKFRFGGKKRTAKKRRSLTKAPKKKTISRRATNLSRLTTPSKSNITATGTLLNSIETRGQKARAILQIQRVTYTKNIQNRQINSGVTTIDVNRFLESQGRRWFALTITQKNRIEEESTKMLRDLARTYL